MLVTSALPHCAARLAERNRAQRPLSTKGDVEKRTWWCSVCVGRAHWNPAVRVNARLKHKNISALPSRWCRMIHSNVHGHSEIFLTLCSESTCKSQMITNEGGRGCHKEHVHHKEEWTLSNPNSKVLVRFSDNPQSCKHVFCEPTGSII